jgi:hypothetical protein
MSREEKLEALAKEFEERPDAGTRNGNVADRIRAILQAEEPQWKCDDCWFTFQTEKDARAHCEMTAHHCSCHTAKAEPRGDGLLEALQELLLDIRVLVPGEPAERMIPTQHSIGTIRKAQDARNAALTSPARTEGLREAEDHWRYYVDRWNECRRALSLAISMIEGGESMSLTARKIFDAALAEHPLRQGETEGIEHWVCKGCGWNGTGGLGTVHMKPSGSLWHEGKDKPLCGPIIVDSEHPNRGR